MKTTILVLACLSFLASCASTPNQTSTAKDQTKKQQFNDYSDHTQHAWFRIEERRER